MVSPSLERALTLLFSVSTVPFTVFRSSSAAALRDLASISSFFMYATSSLYSLVLYIRNLIHILSCTLYTQPHPYTLMYFIYATSSLSHLLYIRNLIHILSCTLYTQPHPYLIYFYPQPHSYTLMYFI